MKPEIIAGAYFYLSEPAGWNLISFKIAQTNDRLARVYQTSYGDFRMLGYEKAPGGPQFIGEWWSETHRVLSGSLDEANQLALNFVATTD